MRYENIVHAKFIKRVNRFVAEVELDGKIETVHVKNTGRCKELLVEGCEVWLTAPGTAGRKTVYDLVSVRKSNGVIFNIDSQAANKVMRKWLDKQGYDRIVPEFTYGSSRIDFYAERGEKRYLTEVKGCTLERDGTGYFPDAPTERGIKHINELIKAKAEGFDAALAFVIQMNGVHEVRANTDTHPEFGKALEEAVRAGVRILYLSCDVTPDTLIITEERKMKR